MRTVAILPVKRFPLAKQRLGESVADALRADLARAMVGDVLSALRECAAVDATIVVTREATVASAARYIDAIVVEDSAPLTGSTHGEGQAGESGQSAAVSLGLARALQDGFERALCIPGDCPTLDPSELTELLADDTNQVVIVPDRHGSGTNGLLLTPPDTLSPSFGAGSRARHERLATEADLRWQIARPASLLLDIDTGEDLTALRERLADERVRAPRTRAVLAHAGAHDGATESTETAPGRTPRAACS